MGLMSGNEDREVTKLKARLGYDWKRITRDEIDMAIRSINKFLNSPDPYTDEIQDLARKLQEKMCEQIPEHMI